VNGIYDSVYPKLPIFAQNWACSVAGYARYRERFSQHYHQTLADWQESLSWPLERLLELQRERLDRLVERARATVPYYRDLPEPSTLSDPAAALRETLSAIPPLDKLGYRDQPDAFIARGEARWRLVRSRTSGTTGTALPLWCSPETLAEEYASVWRLRRSYGVTDPATPNLTFNGNIIVPFDQAKPPFWRTSAYDHRTLFSVYHMTPKNLRAYVEAVQELPARYIEGYPSAIHLVARAMLEQDRALEPGRMAAIFTSSESLLAFQRETIEKAFAAPVRDRYGVSEKVVSMTECDAGSLHVDMEFCIVEVETTEETEDTETGALLVTGLSHDATPMFRYRIGDVGTRSKHPCSCGRAGDVFLAVDGRIEDYVMTPDGRLIGRLDHIFKDQHDVAEAQILQDTKDAVEIRIVPRGSHWDDTHERALLREVRARLGNEIGVRIERVKHIEREPNGKLRAVKSKIGRLAA
jgi:phenylacetate-CoA ligase